MTFLLISCLELVIIPKNQNKNTALCGVLCLLLNIILPGMPMADTHSLRLKSKLFDLRSGYVNRILLHLRFAEPSSNPKPTHQNKNPDHKDRDFVLEVQAGFEPADNGVADRGLTTWRLHQKLFCPTSISKDYRLVKTFFCFCSLFFLKIKRCFREK